MRTALATLRAIGALQTTVGGVSSRETLTPLGARLAELPLAPRLGKILLYGVALCCIEPVLTIAVGMSYRSPFVLPLSARDGERAAAARASFAAGINSDHAAFLHAYDGYAAARAGGGHWRWCAERFLSCTVLEQVRVMRDQVKDQLVRVGVLEPERGFAVASAANVNSGRMEV